MEKRQQENTPVAPSESDGGDEASTVTRLGFLLRGTLGFTLVSLLGFAPWALAGGWFYRHVGEAGLYAVCALVFISSSGPLMHGLILGPKPRLRFYAIFTPAFTAYGIAWTVAWMCWKGHGGSVLGLLVGTALMGTIMTWALDARRQLLKVVVVLFVLNALGYFVGGVFDAWIRGMEKLSVSNATQDALAHGSWAVAYGIGFGAGLGLAFYQCQGVDRARSVPRRRNS